MAAAAAGGAIGWYGPLIDLCKATSHVGDYVQLLVFVHTTRPIQKFKSPKGGTLLRTDVQVGDDTRSYFNVSIWKKEMGAMIASGDVILLQNVKIVKFGDVVEARTVQFSSLVLLAHPSEVLESKGMEALISCCRVGKTTKEKMKKVIKWAQQAKAALHSVQEQTYQRRQLMTNWKVHEEKGVRNCSSISQVSSLSISCKAAFSAFVGEMFLHTGGSNKESEEGMFIRRRLFAMADNKLVEDLLCLGCKLCSHPMALDSGSSLEQNKFPLYCQKSSNRLHSACLIYRPFLLYVWDQSECIPLLVTNKGAELLFGNITAEKVNLSYRKKKNNLIVHKNDEHVITHCGQHDSATTKGVEGEVASSEILDMDGKLQPSKNQGDSPKNLNFYRIWLILLKLLLQQGKNSSLRFEIDVNTELNQENGRFELVSLSMPCTLTDRD